MKKKQEAKYEYAVNGLYKVTADVAAHELERIRDKYGVLNPSYVVEESKEADSVLHDVFCWDDNKAAALYRVTQAQKLINNIKVVVVNKKFSGTVRAFVNVRTSADTERSYIPVLEAIVDETSYKDLLNQAKSEMESFVTKYTQIEELNAVKAEMLKVLNS